LQATSPTAATAALEYFVTVVCGADMATAQESGLPASLPQLERCVSNLADVVKSTLMIISCFLWWRHVYFVRTTTDITPIHPLPH
jgi:hypothetical protein